ncbi:nickel ABC transporter substrate-binding protein [Campylobacterota bacterium DY0563]
MKKLFSILLLAFYLVTISSGELLVSTKKEELKSTLTYVNFRDIRDLNPHLYGGELYAQNLLYEGLVKNAEDGTIQPWLAKSWKLLEDGSTYVFQLRKDVYFHDGEKFNAKAAKANFDAILDNYKRHSWLESMKLLKAVLDKGQEPFEVTGEYELTIRLGKPYYPFLAELGMTRPLRFISPKAFINGGTKKGISALSGTGSYFLAENKTDEYAVFKANAKYWGKKSNINKVIVKVIPDNQTRVLALKNGEIDLIYGSNMIDSETVEQFKNTPGFNVHMSAPVSSRMLMLNTANGFLKDIKVRQAISHAVNKIAISKGLFNGIETPADTLFAKNIPYANIDLEPYEYDVEKAKKMLKDAGWQKIENSKYVKKNGKELIINFNYDTNKVIDRRIAEYLQQEFEKIGVKIEIMGEEKQAFQDRQRSGDFQIMTGYTWGTPYDPQSYISSMRASVHGDYMAQLGLEEKPKIDETSDENKRKEYYDYLLRTLHEKAVYIPLTYSRNVAINSDRIENIKFNNSKFEVPLEKIKIK